MSDIALTLSLVTVLAMLCQWLFDLRCPHHRAHTRVGPARTGFPPPIHRHPFRAAFGWSEFLDKNKNKLVPLFYITPKNLLKPFCVDEVVAPQAGWKIISLLLESRPLAEVVVVDDLADDTPVQP